MEQTLATGISILNPKSALNQPANQKVTNDVPTSFRLLQQEQPKPSSVDAPADEHTVRVVGVDEYKEVAQSLAEAFAEDDVARYFIDVPDREHWTEAEKWKLHVEILEYVTYAHCLKGLVTTVGPGYGAVALWMPPGQNMDDLLTILRSGMWRLNYKLSAEGKRRFFNEFLPLLHDAKHAVLGPRDDDAWYLVYLGTRVQSRGKGYARKLIEHVTQMADAEGRPCYLESSNDVNPVIYGKMGFGVVRRIHLQRGPRNVALDLMVREPVGHEKKGLEKKSEEKKQSHL